MKDKPCVKAYEDPFGEATKKQEKNSYRKKQVDALKGSKEYMVTGAKRKPAP